jgi:hypothetical protein
VVSNPKSKNEKLILDKIAEETWTDRNMQAIGIIVSRMEQELSECIRGLGTAYEVWETLKALSENQSSLLTSRVRSEWEGINFRNETCKTVYLGKLEKCRRLLTGTKAAIGEGELCLKAIKLGTEWKAFTGFRVGLQCIETEINRRTKPKRL